MDTRTEAPAPRLLDLGGARELTNAPVGEQFNEIDPLKKYDE